MKPVEPEIENSELEQLQVGDYDSSAGLPKEHRSVDWVLWLNLLARRRRLLYRTTIWAFVVSTAIAFLLPKHYQSTVTIVAPESLGGNGMMMAALASKASPELAGLAASALGVKSSGALFTSLLRSRTVEDHIVQRFDLQKVYWARYELDARKKLDARISVEEDRKSGIITLTVTDSQPQRARDIAQAFIEELNNLVSQVSTSSARRQRIFIEQRLVAVKADLDDAEQQFSTFASKNTALDIKEQTRAMVESAAALQGQMIAARSELEGLMQMYSTNNFRVRAAQARVDELKRQLQKIGGTDATLNSETNQQADLYPSIRKLPLLGVQWADLYRRVKTQETVYELLNQQYELARIEEAKEVPTVNVVDPADFPQKKSWPPRLLIIAIFMSLSLAAIAAEPIVSLRIKSLDEGDPRRRLAASATESLRRLLPSTSFRLRSNQKGARS
jgi:uncharacterized protein involved in exopolysaccharide biosynthesis